MPQIACLPNVGWFPHSVMQQGPHPPVGGELRCAVVCATRAADLSGRQWRNLSCEEVFLFYGQSASYSDARAEVRPTTEEQRQVDLAPCWPGRPPSVYPRTCWPPGFRRGTCPGHPPLSTTASTSWVSFITLRRLPALSRSAAPSSIPRLEIRQLCDLIWPHSRNLGARNLPPGTRKASLHKKPA